MTALAKRWGTIYWYAHECFASFVEWVVRIHIKNLLLRECTIVDSMYDTSFEASTYIILLQFKSNRCGLPTNVASGNLRTVMMCVLVGSES